MKKILLLSALLPFFVQAQTITTVAGNSLPGYTGDGGPATAACVAAPIGIALDAAGNLYIDGNECGAIRKVSTSGIITAYTDTAAGYSGDGGPASAARFDGPQGMCFDQYGNLFIADGDNHVVRKINTSGIVSTVAGNGTLGYSGDHFAATNAQLRTPSDVKVDKYGNIFIADYQNDVIRKVNTAGIITTIAGNHTGGYSGDGGPATAAQMDWPAGIALDTAGNLYIGDYTNQVVRIVNKKDSIYTFAGLPAGGSGGDGGPATAARLHGPWGVAIDSSGNLLIIDTYNNKVRKVNKAGIISTVAGNGYGSTSSTGAYAGDGGPATAAELYWPAFVAVGSAGSFYISDEGNRVVRKVDTSTPKSTLGVAHITVSANSISILPNPNKGVFVISAILNSATDENMPVEVSNAIGQVVYRSSLFAKKGTINAELALKEGLPGGLYILHIRSESGDHFVRFVISN